MDNEQDRQGILTESGTNEVEIMELLVGDRSFGINVAKVQTVQQFDENALTVLPGGTKAHVGVYRVREQTVPLIDLAAKLQLTSLDNNPRPLVVITEFNNDMYGFLVDGVRRIHRMSWEQIKPLSDFLSRRNVRITGTVSVDGTDILLLDLETIVATNLNMAKAAENMGTVEERRRKVKLSVADDSLFMRSSICKILNDAGYVQIQQFADGKLAFEAISKNPGGSDLLVTDIEMPQMDGLTLCRKLKMDLGLKKLPVIMFSSLINGQMKSKCDEVGADGTITKPEIDRLVGLIDGFLFK